MKLCVTILLGAGDRPCEALGGETPLEAARMPVLTSLARAGRVGGVLTIPRKVAPSTEAALAPIFGVDPLRGIPDAGPLLAAAIEAGVGPDEHAFRMDLVNRFGGTVVDPTAGGLGGQEADVLLESLRSEMGSDLARVVPGMRWRALLLLKHEEAAKARTTSPAQFFGEPLREHLPRRKGGEFLRELMTRAAAVLGEHEINAVRVDLGENPANAAWIWGGGRPAAQPSLGNGVGAAVGGHPSFLGLARNAGLAVLPTGTDGEDAGEVGRAAVAALDEHELVLTLAEGGTLLGRGGDAAGKRDYLQEVDGALLGPLAERLVESGEGRLLVVVTHAAVTDLRRDDHGVMPFLVVGPGTASYGDTQFTEKGAEAADLTVEQGFELLEYAGRP